MIHLSSPSALPCPSLPCFFLQVKDLPGSDMHFFTRVLHRTRDDELMDLIPTVGGSSYL